MIEKVDYLESLVDEDLQKFIISNLDLPPDELLDLCINHLREVSKDD